MKLDYIGILLEEIRDQNLAVLEAVADMQEEIKTLATKASLEELRAEMRTLKLALTDTNRDLRDLRRHGFQH